MKIDGHYDSSADIAWLRFEGYNPARVVSEEVEFGLKEVDPDTGVVVGLEYWRASERLPADLLKLLPAPPVDEERTPGQLAASESSDRMFEASLRGERLYPNGCSFIPSDTPWTVKAIEESRRSGWHVVLCFPGGETQVIKAPLRRAIVRRCSSWLHREPHLRHWMWHPRRRFHESRLRLR